jgi:hypothetical protein
MQRTPLIRLSDFVRQSGLQITTGHLNRLIHSGVLPATRVGFLWHVDPDQALKVLVQPGPASQPIRQAELPAKSDAEPQ